MTRLTGRTCLVTGASRGLGAAIASRFWSEGADLLLVARSHDALVSVAAGLEPRAGQQCHVFACDLAHAESPARIVDEVTRRCGGLSVLVNNAAEQGPIGLSWENDWVEWQRTLQVNLLAAVDLSRRVVPVMAGRAGKIISISGGGATSPRARFSAYATAKAALVRFSETLAHEVADRGIDVNCVAPGALDTAMTQAIVSAGAERAGRDEHQRAASPGAAAAVAIDRAAALCAFLASAESDGITGRLISAVWDRWDTMASHVDELQATDVYTLRRILPGDRGIDWDAE